MRNDAKYLWAYLGPISAVLGIYFGGVWSFGFVYLAFGILPVLELIAPFDTRNFSSETREKNSYFDALVYSHVPILYAVLFYALNKATTQALSTTETIGFVLNIGVFIGAFGINVAHELGHRDHKLEQFLARALLLPALYPHFTIEHNRGHHKNVATPLDPSSARFNENLYHFWWRSVSGVYTEAWQISNEDARKNKVPLFSWKNYMVRITCYQLLYLVVITFVFGFYGLLLAALMGIVGFLLLETVNYIEHYGLQRALLHNGRFENVQPYHSWNSEHALGRIFLYELTRHSDHHFKANKKYQLLQYYAESPQLPFGYPMSMLMSLIPPLWFAVMNSKTQALKVAVI